MPHTMHRERRVNKRIPAEFKVTYIHEGDYLISRSKDISVDGMFIYTEEPPPVGDTPRLTFAVDGREFSVTARVVWVNREAQGADRGMGVQFLDPPDDFRRAILEMVRRVAILNES